MAEQEVEEEIQEELVEEPEPSEHEAGGFDARQWEERLAGFEERHEKLLKGFESAQAHIQRLEEENKEFRGGLNFNEWQRRQQEQTQEEEEQPDRLAQTKQQFMEQQMALRKRQLQEDLETVPDDEQIRFDIERDPMTRAYLQMTDQMAAMQQQLDTFQKRDMEREIERVKQETGVDLNDPTALQWFEQFAPGIREGYITSSHVKSLWELEQADRKKAKEQEEETDPLEVLSRKGRGSPARGKGGGGGTKLQLDAGDQLLLERTDIDVKTLEQFRKAKAAQAKGASK